MVLCLGTRNEYPMVSFCSSSKLAPRSRKLSAAKGDLPALTSSALNQQLVLFVSYIFSFRQVSLGYIPVSSSPVMLSEDSLYINQLHYCSIIIHLKYILHYVHIHLNINHNSPEKIVSLC